jgi:5-methylcytosine-specific restriction protein A
MPPAPKRYCSHPHCRAYAIREGRCGEHQRKRERGVSEAWHHMYSTPEWRRLRLAQLAEEPLCRECRPAVVVATEADHVIPHKGDRALFFDPENLQSLCKPCHSEKTMREMNGT